MTSGATPVPDSPEGPEPNFSSACMLLNRIESVSSRVSRTQEPRRDHGRDGTESCFEHWLDMTDSRLTITREVCPSRAIILQYCPQVCKH